MAIPKSALALLLCASTAQGQVTGYAMTDANIRVAVRECAIESQVGATTTTHDCSQAGFVAGVGVVTCDATFDCPNSQATYGLIETWDTSTVTCFALDASNACNTGGANFDGLFAFMTGFNKPIGAWNTAAVTVYISMFKDTVAFNQPLGWDVGAATTFNMMFTGAAGFDQDLSGWAPVALTNAAGMFMDSAMSTDVRDGTCDGRFNDAGGVDCGDPWGVTGVDASGMYRDSCLEDKDFTTCCEYDICVQPGPAAWSCLDTPAAPCAVVPAPAASASGAARAAPAVMLALVAPLFG